MTLRPRRLGRGQDKPSLRLNHSTWVSSLPRYRAANPYRAIGQIARRPLQPLPRRRDRLAKDGVTGAVPAMDRQAGRPAFRIPAIMRSRSKLDL